jgi:hypothetical protein
MDNQPIQMDDETRQALIDFARTSNELLEGASQASAYRAFNLGCMIGIFPALLIGFIAFLTSNFSWIAAVTTAIIMLIAAMGFAGLAAYLTRARRMERIYQEQVGPEISQKLAFLAVTQAEFREIVSQDLPSNAALIHFLLQDGSTPENIQDPYEGQDIEVEND